MILYPAIDLKDGNCVRLLRGDMEAATVFGTDPAAQALAFQQAGARGLHLVDLNGAFAGRPVNAEAVESILAAVSIPVQLGGGIRDMQTAENYLDCGVRRIILGTAAVENQSFLREAVRTWGGHVAVGVDILDGRVATKGWTQISDLGMEDLLDALSDMGVKTLIATDISRDGAMRGTNLSLYAHIARQWNFQVIASGGVTTLKEVLALRDLDLHGAIVGRALYTGAINLKEALEAVH